MRLPVSPNPPPKRRSPRRSYPPGASRVYRAGCPVGSVEQIDRSVEERLAGRGGDRGGGRAGRGRGGRGTAGTPLELRHSHLEELRVLVLHLAVRAELHAVAVAAGDLERDEPVRPRIRRNDRDRSVLSLGGHLDAEDAARRPADDDALHGTLLAPPVLVLKPDVLPVRQKGLPLDVVPWARVNVCVV